VVSYVDFWVAGPGVHGQESRLPMEDFAVPPRGARQAPSVDEPAVVGPVRYRILMRESRVDCLMQPTI
jgi:hypothetical protein